MKPYGVCILVLMVRNWIVLAEQQQSERIAGVGAGLFSSIVIGMFCLLLCFIGANSSRKCFFFTIAISIAGITAGFMALLHLNKDEETSNAYTSYNFVGVARMIIGIMMIVFTLLAIVSMLTEHLAKTVQGHFVEDIESVSLKRRIF